MDKQIPRRTKGVTMMTEEMPSGIATPRTQQAYRAPFVHHVREFHQKFGLHAPGRVQDLDKETFNFRRNFLEEELDEYTKAWEEGNLPKMLDALVDLQYVLLGTAYLHGFLNQYKYNGDGWTIFDEAWMRVQTANMAKKRAENTSESTRGSTLDIVKPAGWTAPDIEGLLAEHRKVEQLWDQLGGGNDAG